MPQTLILSNEPQPLDITLYQGATFDDYILITDDTGNPVNLTNWHVSSAPKRHADDVTPIFTLNETTGFILGADGKLTYNITPANTSGLVIEGTLQCIHDVKLTDPSNKVRYPVRGNLYIKQAVTA